MSEYLLSYSALLSSPENIAYCRRANSVSELLARIKILWHCAPVGDDELLAEINRLNQIPVDESVRLAGTWLPYRYHAKSRLVNWLVPVGHATEPFQDETISRYRQNLFNQIIQPRTSLAFAQQQSVHIPQATPAGFIFHLSRCGSTLVSGCLSELESTCVFSESPLLTELLLDNTLSAAERKNNLRVFINLQAAAYPHRPQMIIKWNAWDIFHWELICSLYPQVPCLFLVRNPIEILASHQRLAGRHMAGDYLLTQVHPQLQRQSPELNQSLASPIEYQTQVMETLLQKMQAVTDGNCVVDYRQLNNQRILGLCKLLGVRVDQGGTLKIQDRLRFHSKFTGQVFETDSLKKQQVFSAQETGRITARLAHIYNQLLTIAFEMEEKVINA